MAYAIDKTTKKIVSFHVGKRTNKTLKTIIKTLINSQAEKICTDKLRNYQYLIPKEIHSSKRFGTNSIERMNLTIRTNFKRFNRRSNCFSKNIFILNAVLRESISGHKTKMDKKSHLKKGSSQDFISNNIIFLLLRQQRFRCLC